jgi:hypothetical protein
MNASLEEVAMYDLYTAINDLIEQRLKEAVRTGEVINLPDWIDAFAEAFADMIVTSTPEHERDRMIQYALESLSDCIREKRDAINDED